MQERKKKPCSGRNKAKGFKGCGVMTTNRRAGLCPKCYPKYLLEDPRGQETLKKATLQGKKATIKNSQNQSKAKLKKWSISAKSKEHKKGLQDNINKLARMIDSLFFNDCCCCDLKLDKRTAGAHYHSVGSNETIRFHLHNIHKSTFHCNNFKSTHHKDYANKIQTRYGKEYYEYLEYKLQQHPLIKLTNQDIYDKKLLTSKLIRDFDTFKFTDPLKARDTLNKIIGIYDLRE
jgi:hypothetical protein